MGGTFHPYPPVQSSEPPSSAGHTPRPLLSRRQSHSEHFNEVEGKGGRGGGEARESGGGRGGGEGESEGGETKLVADLVNQFDSRGRSHSCGAMNRVHPYPVTPLPRILQAAGTKLKPTPHLRRSEHCTALEVKSQPKSNPQSGSEGFSAEKSRFPQQDGQDTPNPSNPAPRIPRQPPSGVRAKFPHPSPSPFIAAFEKNFSQDEHQSQPRLAPTPPTRMGMSSSSSQNALDKVVIPAKIVDGGMDSKSGRSGWQMRPLVAVQIGRGKEERGDEGRKEREREREKERRMEREEERRREEEKKKEWDKEVKRSRKDDRSRKRDNHVLATSQESRSASPVYSIPIMPEQRPPSPPSDYENVDIPFPSPKGRPLKLQLEKTQPDRTWRNAVLQSPGCYENLTIHNVWSHSHSSEPLGQAEGVRGGVGMALKPQKPPKRQDYENISILMPAGPIPYPLNNTSSDDNLEALNEDEAPSTEIIYESFGFNKGKP